MWCFVRSHWKWLVPVILVLWAGIHPVSLGIAIGMIIDWLMRAIGNLIGAVTQNGDKVTKVTGNPVDLICNILLLIFLCRFSWVWFLKKPYEFVFGGSKPPAKKGKK